MLGTARSSPPEPAARGGGARRGGGRERQPEASPNPNAPAAGEGARRLHPASAQGGGTGGLWSGRA